MKNKMIFSLHAQEFVVMQNKTDLYFSCVERFLYLVSNIFSNAMFEFFVHSYTIGWNILWTNFLISFIKIFCIVMIFFSTHQIVLKIKKKMNKQDLYWLVKKIEKTPYSVHDYILRIPSFCKNASKIENHFTPFCRHRNQGRLCHFFTHR